MSRPRLNLWLALSCVGGVAYPLLTYFGMGVLPSVTFVLLGLALIGMRLLVLRRRSNMEIWKISFLTAIVALVGMLFLNARLAALAYPVIVSLSVASVFTLSLFFPPTMVERLARLSEPDLPPKGVIYTRRVTLIWAVFLFMNASISAATALWGTLAQWTLWNGLISYLLMGTLFLGEMAVRRVVRR